MVVAVTSTKSQCFNPLSLDAINFLLADVQVLSNHLLHAIQS